MRSFHHAAVRAAAALLLCAATAMPAAAQDQPSEFPSFQVPGWTFTPGVAFGTLYDSNVAIAGPDEFGKTASDSSFQMEPFGQLEFFSPRTSFSSGYRGSLRRYFDLTDLDSVDHRAYFTLRHHVSRRITVFGDESFSQLPTTDALQLNGLPFARVGARYNAAGAGVDARLTRSLDLSTRYDMAWVEFLSQTVSTPLTGGVVHGIRTDLTHRFNARLSAGGEYGFRWADLNNRLRQFNYQDVGGVLQYRGGENTHMEFGAGMSHLLDRVTNSTRTSPYARFSITHRTQRATYGADYRRSYAPSFYLGGSHQGQEVKGYVDMPFRRNRLYVSEMASWRRSSPIVVTNNPLDTVWVRSSLGYTVQRWIRVEGYHYYMNQDNSLAGGQITRQLLGVQLVISEPVRIR